MIRVLIADDHRLVRDCFRALLDREPDIAVIRQARDGREAVEMAERLMPDIVLMELRLVGQNALEAMEQIRPMDRPRVIVLTMLDDQDSVRQAICNGACGFLTKDEGFFELVAAIRAVQAGQAFQSQDPSLGELEPACMPKALSAPNRTTRMARQPTDSHDADHSAPET